MVTRFETTPFSIGSTTVLLLPIEASSKLPSRGMVMVKGTINDASFHTALEPDGKGSHWLDVDDALLKAANARDGDTVSVTIESSKEWPEPTVPVDLQSALAADEQANDVWKDVTPMARWDWIRWVRATNNPDTRKHHVEVALSKMKHGTRRPC